MMVAASAPAPVRRNRRADAIERNGGLYFPCVAPGCTREMRWAGIGQIPQLCPEEHRRMSHAIKAPAASSGCADLVSLLDTPGVASIRFPGGCRVVTPWGSYTRDDASSALEAAVQGRSGEEVADA